MQQADRLARPDAVVLADGRRRRGQRDRTVGLVIIRFAVGTVLALVAIVVAGYAATTKAAEEEALRDVRRLAEAVTVTAIEPRVDDLLAGDAEAFAALDESLRLRLMPRSAILRVKLWTAQGRVVYSDEPTLIGEVHPLGEDELEVLETGVSATELSDLVGDENRLERPLGAQLVEVYASVHTGGEPMLFEAYVSADEVEQRRAVILRSFAWVALLGLAVFAAFQRSLALANLRWLQKQRVRLAERAAALAEAERRRVARDLHDGVVQDLVGASYVVDGAVGPLAKEGRSDLAESLSGAVVGIRTSIRGLRSMIIDIYPASLRSAGLRAALDDLVAPLQARGITCALVLPDPLDLPTHVEAAVYRAAQEAVRNVSRHGRASHVTIEVRTTPGGVELVVDDDGVGFDPHQRPPSGHMGLTGLADLAADLAGVLEVRSAPGRGTLLRMELPA